MVGINNEILEKFRELEYAPKASPEKTQVPFESKEIGYRFYWNLTAINSNFYIVKNGQYVGPWQRKDLSTGKITKGSGNLHTSMKTLMGQAGFHDLPPERLAEFHDFTYSHNVFFYLDENPMPYWYRKLDIMEQNNAKLIDEWDGEVTEILESADTFHGLALELGEFRGYNDPFSKKILLFWHFIQENKQLHRDNIEEEWVSHFIPIDYRHLQCGVRTGLLQFSDRDKLDLEACLVAPTIEGTAREAYNNAMEMLFDDVPTEKQFAFDQLIWGAMRSICTQIDPQCGKCPLNNLCEKHINLWYPINPYQENY